MSMLRRNAAAPPGAQSLRLRRPKPTKGASNICSSPFRGTAVILAAGAGSRLGALGRLSSKAMLPIGGKPLVAWVIERLRAAGVGPFIVVGHPTDGPLAKFCDHAPGVTLLTQPERRGIADALRCALPRLAAAEGYLACACDSLFDADDIRRLIACGRAAAGAAAVGVLDMGVAATATRSAVRLDGERVVEIVEKPRAASASAALVAAPLYWLPRAFAAHIEAVPDTGEAYISTALQAFIREGGAVWAVHLRGRIEITTAEDVARAHEILSAHTA